MVLKGNFQTQQTVFTSIYQQHEAKKGPKNQAANSIVLLLMQARKFETLETPLSLEIWEVKDEKE